MKDAPHVAAERPLFERWAKSQGYRVDRTKPYGVYKDRRSNSAWAGWIARAEEDRKVGH